MELKIGQISESIGAVYTFVTDSQKMRIASQYIPTPLDTQIKFLSGNGYSFQIYYYKEDVLESFSGWNACTGAMSIKSSEYSGFALKVRKGNYGVWSDSDIEAFAKTVSVESA